jgi:hypothetical protein
MNTSRTHRSEKSVIFSPCRYLPRKTTRQPSADGTTGVPPMAAAARQEASIPMVSGTSVSAQGPAHARPALALVDTHTAAAAWQLPDPEGHACLLTDGQHTSTPASAPRGAMLLPAGRLWCGRSSISAPRVPSCSRRGFCSNLASEESAHAKADGAS